MRAFPAWTGVDGYPLSWRHYVYGMAHLPRANARETLRQANAAAAGHSDKQGWQQFTRELETAAR